MDVAQDEVDEVFSCLALHGGALVGARVHAAQPELAHEPLDSLVTDRVAGLDELGGEGQHAFGSSKGAGRSRLSRAVAFSRWRAADVRSILAAGSGVAQPQPAGRALVIELPTTTSRGLDAYGLNTFTTEPDDHPGVAPGVDPGIDLNAS